MSSQKQFPKLPIGAHPAGLVQSCLCELGEEVAEVGLSDYMSVGASAGWTEFMV